MNKTPFNIPPAFATAFLTCLLIFSGCDSAPSGDAESSQSGKNAATAKTKLPKLTFHKPKSLDLAVLRLRECHDALLSESKLPDPVVFKVVETVHGDHSHYHLAGEEHEGHHEEDEEELLHNYEVDMFTEMHDVARWLPRIAGDSDLAEDDWNSVKETSEKLTLEIGELFKDSDPVQKRKSYQSNCEQSENLIGELEKTVSTSDPSASEG